MQAWPELQVCISMDAGIHHRPDRRLPTTVDESGARRRAVQMWPRALRGVRGGNRIAAAKAAATGTRVCSGRLRGRDAGAPRYPAQSAGPYLYGAPSRAIRHRHRGGARRARQRGTFAAETQRHRGGRRIRNRVAALTICPHATYLELQPEFHPIGMRSGATMILRATVCAVLFLTAAFDIRGQQQSLT